jgi:hypothetical protein
MTVPAKKRKISTRDVHTIRTHQGSLLDEFHCEGIVYEFVVPASDFNLAKFSRETGVKLNESWSAVAQPKDTPCGYHVHFDGRVNDKRAKITVAFWQGKSAVSNPESPFAESFMPWLAGFLGQKSPRAVVWAYFEKPKSHWRPRFNLPFRVTLGVAEVTIDGVSLVLPRNQFRAVEGRLSVTSDKVKASVKAIQPINLMTFDIKEAVVSFNQAIDIFVERLP